MNRLALRVRKLVAALSDPRSRHALRLGVAPTVEAESLLRRIGPAIIIDVGANRGQFSLASVRSLGEPRIIAVEPLPAEAQTYRRLFASDDRVTLHQCAAGADPAQATINVTAATDSSSLLRPVSGSRSVVSEERVQVVRLDEMLDVYELSGETLLKIDVQGFELEVLRGAERLFPSIDWVLCEVSFIELYEGQPLVGEIVGYLYDAGYELVDGLQPSSSGGRLTQQDLLFRRVTPS